MAQLNVTELDFDNIKSSLKQFLSTQDEFLDYDFEGSAINVLMDLLSYNTHYNAILAHMLANESFIDSAIKRSSVVSIAKALGYVPRSAVCSSATITLKVTPDPSYSSSSLALSRDTGFTATVDGQIYTFYPQEETTVAREIDTDGVAKFIFRNILLKEGYRVTNRYRISDDNRSGPLTIPNSDVDTSTLRVRVQTSDSEPVITTYTNYSNLTDIKATTRAYFIEEDLDGLFTIRFGDDIIGKKLQSGNIVLVDYIVASKSVANNAKTFACSRNLSGGNESKEVITVYNSAGGANRESIDSIRVTAPRYNQTRNRAVTAKDYEALILQFNSNIQSCAVWGGEENDPPIYGKVFISLNPKSGQVITDQDKANITTEVIRPKAPLGISAEYVDPIYTYINLKIGVIYNPRVTTQTSGAIGTAVTRAVSDYFAADLNVLNKNFYISRLHEYVKGVSDSIISVNIIPKLQKRIALTKDYAQQVNLVYNTKIEPRTLHSTWANYKITGASIKAKIVDVPDSNVLPPNYNGKGKIYLQTVAGNNEVEVGTVDYDTGKIQFTVTLASYIGDDLFIRYNVKPHDDVKDIKTQSLVRTTEEKESAVAALPSRNIILTQDDTALNTTTGARVGLEVNVSRYVEE